MKIKFPKKLNYVKPPSDETWLFLESIDWFSGVGRDSNLNFEEAVKLASSHEWEDFTLERRNDITSHLAVKHRNRESEWNKVVVGYRNYCEEQISPYLTSAANIMGFDKTVIQSVTWNIISFMMEETYASWGVPRFFNLTMDSLKNGQLPCGWFGEYPDGYLLKY